MFAGKRIAQLWRLALALVLLGVLGTAGYRRGYQTGYAPPEFLQTSGGELYIKSYSVGDLVVPIGLDPTTAAGRSAADFDPLIDLILTSIEHDSWLTNGIGEGEIQPYPSNLYLAIAQTERVHAQIGQHLEQLRSLSGEIQPASWIPLVQSLAAYDRPGSQCLLQFPSNDEAKAAAPSIFARSVNNTVELWGRPAYGGVRTEYGFPAWCDGDEIAYWTRGEGYAYLVRKSVTSQDQPAVLQFIAGWRPADKW